MASRKPRIQPRLTRTEALRQSRSATIIREYEGETGGRQPQPVDPGRRRQYVPPESKRTEFTRPTVTKAATGRLKQSEKFKEEYERKQESVRRRPRRMPAPIGGDPRVGRERLSRVRAPETFAPIPERTKELARSMNAQVVQAEPIGEGPIDSVVIPPKSVDENRTTIVRITQPLAAGIEAARSEVANRSIRVISETLDDQDAAEAATVQGKLEDLQQARRDFVMAVANVGGNAVQLAEKERPMIQSVPDIESEMFRIEYGLEHPSIVAAREFAQRSMAGLRARKEARTEQEFERIVQEPLPEDLRLDVPFEAEFSRPSSIYWEDEEGRRVSRTKRGISRHERPYEYPTFDPEELERFFDVEQYPPPRIPPPGREHLPSDLWDIEDPWGYSSQEENLIRFESP